MAKFELTGPDGGKYQLEAPNEAAALAAFGTFTGAKPAEEAPVTTNDIVRSTATGVPIVGGVLNTLNAATNAALAPVVEPFLEKGPDTLDQPTFGERFRKSKAIQDAKDKKFAEESPVIDTTAKIAGGVAGTIPMVMAAPAAFGATGTLPQMITRGAASGALLSGADAGIRGEPVPSAAGIGLATGAAAPLIAKAIGAGVRAVRGVPDPIHQNVTKVGDVEIPLWESQVTGEAAASRAEQQALAGAAGPRAEQLAKEAEALQLERVAQAREGIGASLDPTGASPATAPQKAGEQVLAELTAAEQQRAAQEAAAAALAQREGVAVSRQVGAGEHYLPAGNYVAADALDAGQALGAGVANQRNAAATARDAKYTAARGVEGEFDASVPRTLADDIRGRLTKGDDPVWIDQDTTAIGNKALRAITETLGPDTGLLRNAAGSTARPVGPVAEAAAAPVPAPVAPSEAAQAFQELTTQGVNPVRARQAVAGMEGAESLPRGPLDPHTVALPGGGSVEVRPRVVEADQVLTSADAGYDKSLQPRNRARAASSAQVDDISKNLNPERLGISSEADRGAPIIGADGMVESGNGRTLAIRQAYEEGGEAAAKYREWLRSQGVDVSKFKNPVLVRERVTPMDPEARKAFTVAANQSSTLSLSATERALADARTLTPESLAEIRNPADLGAVENRDFVRSFMQQVPAAERGALMTANGDLSAEGLTRVRNAVLGKAYGDTPILARIAESTSDDVKSISNALVAAAPEWAGLKAAIAQGAVPAELDATEHLLNAVARTAKIRGKGVSLADDMAQADAFNRPSRESEQFMRLFYDADGKRAAPASQVSNALRHYAQEAAKVDAGPGLFGAKPLTASEILETTAAKVGAPKELAKEVQDTLAARAVAESAADAPAGAVGLREMDAARKRLILMFGDAKSAAVRTGDRSDLRVMGRIMHEFDNVILDAFESGKFSGDGELAQRLLKEARAAHTAFRSTYSSRGPGDEVGRTVEKILGRYADSAMTPDQVAKASYGSLDKPGGGQATKVAIRLRSIVGETSPEWGAYKQGLVSMLEGPAGTSPAKVADRIDTFLTGAQGRILANTVFSAEERAGLQSYARSLRAAEPQPSSALDNVDKVIARLSGRSGGPPASANEVVDQLFSRSGKANKEMQFQLANRLKNELSPEGWNAVRQGMWQKLTNAGEGKIEFGPQALSQRITEFLNESGSSLAKTMFTAAERRQMADLAAIYTKMIPVKGTTNPSGTGQFMAKALKQGSNNLLAMLGAATNGFGGLALGWAGDKVVRGLANRSGAREATRLFYGQQRKPPIRSSRVPIVLGQGAAPQADQR